MSSLLQTPSLPHAFVSAFDPQYRLYGDPSSLLPPMADEQVETLDRLDDVVTADLKKQGWWRTKPLLPACRVFGPLLPPANGDGARDMYARCLARSHLAGQAFNHLQGRMVAEDTPAQDEPLPCHHPAAGYVFQSEQGHLDGAGVFLRDGLPALSMRMNLRTMVFVHFFSGFRRRHDLHEILSHQILPNGLQIFAISVDMCLQRVAGDLASDASLAFWRDQVLSGRVFGAGGGPPCETFTAARLLEGGPRAVRSDDDVTGLPYLTAREWRQVIIGTRLVHFILDILYLLARTGGCGFCEHPQYPVWCASKAPCSIWALEATKKLKQLQCVSIVSFDQCVLQAPIRKPTTLMLVRLWDFRSTVLASGRAGRCAHGWQAHEQLIGRDASGQFRTARGKIYPPHMNRALGHAIRLYVERTFPSSESHSVADMLPEIFQRFAQADFVDCGEVQRDYHG